MALQFGKIDRHCGSRGGVVRSAASSIEGDHRGHQLDYHEVSQRNGGGVRERGVEVPEIVRKEMPNGLETIEPPPEVMSAEASRAWNEWAHGEIVSHLKPFGEALAEIFGSEAGRFERELLAAA